MSILSRFLLEHAFVSTLATMSKMILSGYSSIHIYTKDHAVILVDNVWSHCSLRLMQYNVQEICVRYS
jgi:hypothetical protein